MGVKNVNSLSNVFYAPAAPLWSARERPVAPYGLYLSVHRRFSRFRHPMPNLYSRWGDHWFVIRWKVFNLISRRRRTLGSHVFAKHDIAEANSTQFKRIWAIFGRETRMWWLSEPRWFWDSQQQIVKNDEYEVALTSLIAKERWCVSLGKQRNTKIIDIFSATDSHKHVLNRLQRFSTPILP